MRVLFWMNEKDALMAGGHRIQFEQTMRHLEQLGVKTVFTTCAPSSWHRFDLVHGYNISAADIRFCKRQNLPVVLSTIYRSINYRYPKSSLLGSALSQIGSNFKMALVLASWTLAGKHELKCRSIIASEVKRVAAYESADLLLPNAHGEAALIVKELAVTTPQKVIVNGVDTKLFELPDKQSASTRSYVLYCGRIEPHKNQLGLLHAMRGKKIPLVLVGTHHPDHKEYYQKVQEIAGKDRYATVLPAVSHEELKGLYWGAKVHAMPSFFESTGLVSLEAAVSGCNIVSGDRGYIKEYFEDDVWYCDPYRRQSVSDALTTAYESPYNSALEERIVRKYTWAEAAAQTMAAYQSLLDGETPGEHYDETLAALTRI